MTLTDFLLARIAEDEEVARSVETEDARTQYVIGYEHDSPDTSFWADYDGARPSVSVGAGRVLAECAAKRRIVQRYRWTEDHLDDGPTDLAGWSDDRATLLNLAAVYADHSDYREEWRP